MASQSVSDKILKHLYISNYRSSIDVITRDTRLERSLVTNNLEALVREGSVKSGAEHNTYTITRLGIYYLEMQKLVTEDQIDQNERVQLYVLSTAEEASSVDVERPKSATDEAIAANTALLVASGLLQDGNVITADGSKQLKYLRSKYPAAVKLAIAG